MIAYFTAAENSGVDAVSSASYTTIGDAAVGRLRAVADMIQENTRGDLFSIQTSVVYPADGGERGIFSKDTNFFTLPIRTAQSGQNYVPGLLQRRKRKKREWLQWADWLME